MTRRQIKITKHQLETITGRFMSFLKGETNIMADEAFQNAVQSYHDVFLKSERVIKMVQSGACSQHDFREVFRNNIEKRVRSLPEIDGLSKETVLTSWMAKFDCILKGTGDDDQKRPSRMNQPLNSELILSKEQLYDMFQQILSVKKFEHQILFNALLVSYGRPFSIASPFFSFPLTIHLATSPCPFLGIDSYYYSSTRSKKYSYLHLLFPFRLEQPLEQRVVVNVFLCLLGLTFLLFLHQYCQRIGLEELAEAEEHLYLNSNNIEDTNHICKY